MEIFIRYSYASCQKLTPKRFFLKNRSIVNLYVMIINNALNKNWCQVKITCKKNIQRFYKLCWATICKNSIVHFFIDGILNTYFFSITNWNMMCYLLFCFFKPKTIIYVFLSQLLCVSGFLCQHLIYAFIVEVCLY